MNTFPLGGNTSEYSPSATIMCLRIEHRSTGFIKATKSVNLIVKDSFETSAIPPWISKRKQHFSSCHDKSCSSQVLSYDHQKSRCNHIHTDKSFDHLKIKCQDLRPTNIVPTEISDATSLEAIFAYKGPDPAPSQAVTTLLPNHCCYCIFTVGSGSSHPWEPLTSQHLLATQLSLKVSHPNKDTTDETFSCVQQQRSPLWRQPLMLLSPTLKLRQSK